MTPALEIGVVAGVCVVALARGRAIRAGQIKPGPFYGNGFRQGSESKDGSGLRIIGTLLALAIFAVALAGAALAGVLMWIAWQEGASLAFLAVALFALFFCALAIVAVRE